MRQVFFMLMAVSVAGLIITSCGGGNINRVKNGVFNYDDSITVGNALEKNKYLKGGKWDKKKIEGRNYVIYTVSFNKSQIEEILKESRLDTNLKIAEEFYKSDLKKWASYNDLEYLSQITSITKNDIDQSYNIFSKTFSELNNKRNNSPDIIKYLEEEKIFNDKIDDSMIDPFLFTIMDKVVLSETVQLSQGYIFPGIIREEYVREMLRFVLKAGIYSTNTDSSIELDVENGELINKTKEVFDEYFGKTNYAKNRDFINAIINTKTKYYNSFIKARENYSKAREEFDNFLNKDIEPMLTINGYEIILSFVINQDNTFDINVMESYTNITLLCYNNMEVNFNAGISDNPSNLLPAIFRGFIPDLF